jgi:GTP cyclohydrolase I
MSAPKTPSPRPAEARLEAVSRAVAELIRALGLDTKAEPELAATPERVARLYQEIFSGLDPAAEPELVTFEAPESEGDLVMVRDLGFYSLCVHHFVPFFGRAHVAYLPGERMLGISAPARLVEYYARRPQLQERMGRQIVEHLARATQARGAAILIEARHLCMEMRGVRARGLVQTWAAVGELAPPARADALRAQLLAGRGGRS